MPSCNTWTPRSSCADLSPATRALFQPVQTAEPAAAPTGRPDIPLASLEDLLVLVTRLNANLAAIMAFLNDPTTTEARAGLILTYRRHLTDR